MIDYEKARHSALRIAERIYKNGGGFPRAVNAAISIYNVEIADEPRPDDEAIVNEWREARRAFLALPAGHADARAALNRLSEAEDRLYNAT